MMTSTSTPGSMLIDVCFNFENKFLKNKKKIEFSQIIEIKLVRTYNLLDYFRWTVQINDTLVNTHLVSVPSFGTFTAWCFACCDSQYFCWHSDWSEYFKLFFFGAFDKVSAYFFKTFHVGACQSNSDTVH